MKLPTKTVYSCLQGAHSLVGRSKSPITSLNEGAQIFAEWMKKNPYINWYPQAT